MYAHPCIFRRARRTSERGFTLIELVVACVLLGIVGIMITRSVMDANNGYLDSKSNSEGMAQAAEAAERLGADLRVARAIGRSGTVMDPSDLRDAIDTNTDLVDLATGTSLDWRDITEATPNSVTFQADVVDETTGGDSPECVRWFVSGTSPWHVRREVRPYSAGCAGGGTLLEADEMTQPTTSRPAPGTGGTPRLFSFVLATASANTNVFGCTSMLFTGTPSPAQRNRITSVRIDFRSLAQRRNSAGNAALMDEISLRSRNATDYQDGMRCQEA